jgi:thiol:disulfide interchange protein DsbD
MNQNVFKKWVDPMWSCFLVLLLVSSFAAKGQMLDPVRWTWSYKAVNDSTARLLINARIDKGWHLYSQFMKFGPDQIGPEPTVFKFTFPAGMKAVGNVRELTKAHEEAAPLFDSLVVRSFDGQAQFSQEVRVRSGQGTVKGSVYYMACDDHQCLAPQERDMTWDLQGFAQGNADQTPGSTAGRDQKIQTTKEGTGNMGWLALFLAGFAGGLLALLTPCVFPMIPLTVSYFTKQSGTPGKALIKAMGYGLSIVIIYVGLGMGVTLVFGSDALNDMASNLYFNLAFFVMLMIFGFSFLGAFEITLPSSWTNSADRQADKGGWAGIFFMAFTLALVSFSCTGPIIGTLLVEAAVQGALMGPAVGMLGFSLALALPFTLFAIFPRWLQQLPKSGSWMNSVKVVLGFLELAFALKFLSNVDLAYHWGVLDREIFLVLWIGLFTLLTLYLLGFIRFAHDSPMAHLGLIRMSFALASLCFTLYLVPGLWGAPLHAVNAFLPPMATQDFVMGGTAPTKEVKGSLQPRKYSDILHAPHGLPCFFDLDEAMAYARTVNKPVMLDFTGHSCVNCRKMEATVWSLPDILERLRNDVVLVSLYVDDKTALPASEQYRSSFSGKWIDRLGSKCSDLQATRYNTNSQPYYLILDLQGNSLVPHAAYDPDPELFRSFLNQGIQAFHQGNRP